MVENKNTNPHYYLTMEVEMDALISLRTTVNAAQEAKTSVNDYVIKACALALQEVRARACTPLAVGRRRTTVQDRASVGRTHALIAGALRAEIAPPRDELLSGRRTCRLVKRLCVS